MSSRAGNSWDACHAANVGLPSSRAKAGATRHFDIRGDYAALAVPVPELGALFDEVYEYVSERTGLRVNGLIPVTVKSAFPEICPPRGRASSFNITIFVNGTTSREQLLGVLGHELGHVLRLSEKFDQASRIRDGRAWFGR